MSYAIDYDAYCYDTHISADSFSEFDRHRFHFFSLFLFRRHARPGSGFHGLETGIVAQQLQIRVGLDVRYEVGSDGISDGIEERSEAAATPLAKQSSDFPAYFAR